MQSINIIPSPYGGGFADSKQRLLQQEVQREADERMQQQQQQRWLWKQVLSLYPSTC